MFVSDVRQVVQCLQLLCVTCRLSCLDEELLLLRDREDIFCDMAELRSSEPISMQTGQCRATAGVPGAFLYQEKKGWRRGQGERVWRERWLSEASPLRAF